MDPPQGTLLGDAWRATPRSWKVLGALVLLGLAAWGVSGAVDGMRRARLRAEIREFLAALPPGLPEPAVAEADDAAPVFLEAFAAVDLVSTQRGFLGTAATPWTVPPPEVVKGLEANAEALRLMAAALAKPAFSPVGVPPPPPGSAPGTGWDLSYVAYVRALVALRGGDPAKAVQDALLAPRMARRIGPGRLPPWNFAPMFLLPGSLEVLEGAVADPRLDAPSAEAILRHLPTGGEARAASSADFEATNVRDFGKRLADLLAPDAEEKARARGWRPPTMAQRWRAKLGGNPSGYPLEEFPSTGEVRLLWEAALAHRAVVGLRGKEASARLAAIPWRQTPGIYVRDDAGQHAQNLRTEFVVEARLEVVRAAAALRLLEMRAGRPPTSLGDLVPGLLPSPGTDPYTGGPLRFEVLPDGWEVASAGPGAEWHCYASWKDTRPGIRWKRPAPVPQDGGK